MYNGAELTADAFQDAWGNVDSLIPVTNWNSLADGGDRVSLWDRSELYEQDHEAHDNAIVGVEFDNNEPWPFDEAGLASIFLTNLSAVDLNDGSAWASSISGEAGAHSSSPTEAPGNNTGSDIGSPGVLPPTDLQPPTVSGVQFNSDQVDPADLPARPQPTNWQTQRSDIRSIQVTFSEAIQIGSDDIVLTNLGVNAPVDADEVVQLQPDQLTIAEDLLTIQFGAYALADGVYQLEILESATDLAGNLLDGDENGSSGGSFTFTGNEANGFYKLASDFNGDRGGSIFDFSTFAYWFGKMAPVAPEYVDLNRDGGVSIFDFTIFAAHFEMGIIFAAGPLVELGEDHQPNVFQTPSADADSEQSVRRSSAPVGPNDILDQRQRPSPETVPASVQDQALTELIFQWKLEGTI